MAADIYQSFEHDENMQAFEQDERVLIAVVDETYGVSSDDEWEGQREQFRLDLEREFGLRFEEGNIGPGADLPAFLTILQTGVEVPAWVLVSSIFFAGKPLLENLEAWATLASKLRPFLERRVFLNRQGSAAIAIESIFSALGRQPGRLQLLSYRAVPVTDPDDLSTLECDREIAEALPTLYLGFIRHIFEVEADGIVFRVLVEGGESKLLERTD